VKKRANLIWLAVLFGALPAVGAPKGGPSRAPVKGCAWEKLSDAKLGLEAWVQRCDFGFRKIDFLFTAGSLAVRFSDGGGPDPLVDVLDLLPDETAEAGVKRLFAARTEKGLVSRCVMAAPRGTKTPPGVKRFTFVPNASYQKELSAKADPNEVGDPPCGEWGSAPDGIQYFEAQPASGARKVLFVRVGQDEPLFDEKTLRLFPR
jgi:hypothetical protein